MGCCKGFFKGIFGLLMILINIPLLLIACVFIVFGSMAAWALPTLIDWLSGATIDSELQQIIIDFLNYIDVYLYAVSITVFVIGVILFFISFCGFCGVCCNSVCLMATFATLVGIVAIGSTIFSLIFAIDSSLITSELAAEANKSLSAEFNDPDNPALAGNFSTIDPIAAGWILMFRDLPCCGVYTGYYTDFQYSPKWNRRYQYSSNLGVPRAVVPVMCCKNKAYTTDTFGNNYLQPNLGGFDTSCLDNPTADNAYITIGCIDHIATSSAATWVIFGISIGLIVVFVLAVILTICYKKKRSRSDSNDYEMSYRK